MCLLHALSQIKTECSLELVGAHFNHNWRGDASKNEQIECEKFCKLRNIEFFTQTAPSDSKKTETVARELRYDFFEKAQKKYNTNIVFTAHNFEDNAETLIYRISKGTGIVGLKGIQQKRANYYRPLIEIKRADIENYCKENNLYPNNDSSNNNTVYKRNLIRHKIIPELKRINPNVVNSINNLSKIAQCELSILDEYLDKIKTDLIQNNTIKTEKFSELSPALKQKIIYDYIYSSEIDYDFKLIENAVEFLTETIQNKKVSKFSLDRTHWLYADSKRIEIITNKEKNNDEIEITKEGSYSFNNKTLTITKYQKENPITKDETCIYADLSGYKKLTLRTRRQGDIIQPLGFDGTMKLKKYLMSKKIAQHARDNLILLCDEKEVLWVAGIGLSEKIKTTKISTHKLELKENP